jgi:hypothetical protein
MKRRGRRNSFMLLWDLCRVLHIELLVVSEDVFQTDSMDYTTQDWGKL